MTCRRSGTFSTGVVAAGVACPAVVVWGAAGGLDTCGAELLLEVGDGNMQFLEVLQGDEELGVDGRAVCGEGAVGCSESFVTRRDHWLWPLRGSRWLRPFRFGRRGWPTDRRGCPTGKRRRLWSSTTHAILGGPWLKIP